MRIVIIICICNVRFGVIMLTYSQNIPRMTSCRKFILSFYFLKFYINLDIQYPNIAHRLIFLFESIHYNSPIILHISYIMWSIIYVLFLTSPSRSALNYANIHFSSRLIRVRSQVIETPQCHLLAQHRKLEIWAKDDRDLDEHTVRHLTSSRKNRAPHTGFSLFMTQGEYQILEPRHILLTSPNSKERGYERCSRFRS